MSFCTDTKSTVPPEEPGSPQLLERVATNDQRADASGIAEDLVKRDGDEIRLVATQTERIARYERGGVQQNVIAEPMRVVDQRERVSHAGKVRLGRERE